MGLDFANLPISVWVLIAVVGLLQTVQFTKHSLIPGIPVVGRKWAFEPLLITRFRFILNGWEIVREGVTKYPNSPFTIVRPDSNVTVLPSRYVDELRNIADDKLHPLEALTADLHGDITGMTVLLGTHLSFNVIRNKVTPRLGSMVATFASDAEAALDAEMPAACKDGWVLVDMNNLMNRVVSRLTARTWVGEELARTDAWHTANIEVTKQIFSTAIILKCLPGFLHPLVAPLLPTRWELKKCIELVHSYLVPEIERRLDRMKKGDKEEERPKDVIQWMLEEGTEEERDPSNLATRYVFAVLGSLFTVSAGLVDCVYNMMAHPECLEPLRDELQRVLAEEGGWNKGTPARLVKMDSFMKESQRVDAPTPISFKRIVRQPVTLSDGLQLPKGAYICTPVTSTIGRESEPFDGFRYSKKSEDGGTRTSRDQYTSTDRDHIIFGHGRYACPGRYLASVEMKAILAAMLTRYDLKYDGEGLRPRNLQLLELAIQDPRARVLVRQRDTATEP